MSDYTDGYSSFFVCWTVGLYKQVFGVSVCAVSWYMPTYVYCAFEFAVSGCMNVQTCRCGEESVSSDVSVSLCRCVCLAVGDACGSVYLGR